MNHFTYITKLVLNDTQFIMPMEMIGNESGNAPKCYYSMDVSQDFTPLSVLSESSSQGKHIHLPVYAAFVFS